MAKEFITADKKISDLESIPIDQIFLECTKPSDYKDEADLIIKVWEQAFFDIRDWIIKIAKSCKMEYFDDAVIRQFLIERFEIKPEELKEEGSMKKGKCVKCRGELKYIRTSFKGQKIDAYKCKKCGEEYFEPKQAQKILEKNKQKFSKTRKYDSKDAIQIMLETLREMLTTMERITTVMESLNKRLQKVEGKNATRKR
jgi:hypothetical protein